MIMDNKHIYTFLCWKLWSDDIQCYQNNKEPLVTLTLLAMSLLLQTRQLCFSDKVAWTALLATLLLYECIISCINYIISSDNITKIFI
jgi:hypothetical protein